MPCSPGVTLYLHIYMCIQTYTCMHVCSHVCVWKFHGYCTGTQQDSVRARSSGCALNPDNIETQPWDAQVASHVMQHGCRTNETYMHIHICTCTYTGVYIQVYTCFYMRTYIYIYVVKTCVYICCAQQVQQ